MIMQYNYLVFLDEICRVVPSIVRTDGIWGIAQIDARKRRDGNMRSGIFYKRFINVLLPLGKKYTRTNIPALTRCFKKYYIILSCGINHGIKSELPKYNFF